MRRIENRCYGRVARDRDFICLFKFQFRIRVSNSSFHFTFQVWISSIHFEFRFPNGSWIWSLVFPRYWHLGRAWWQCNCPLGQCRKKGVKNREGAGRNIFISPGSGEQTPPGNFSISIFCKLFFYNLSHGAPKKFTLARFFLILNYYDTRNRKLEIGQFDAASLVLLYWPYRPVYS